MTETQRRMIAFAILGLVSGAIAAITVVPFAVSNDARLLVIFVAPGLVFGVIIGGALCLCGWLRPGRLPAWIVIATLGHFAAALCVIALTSRLREALPLAEQSAIAIAAALGGAVGGGMLAVANRFLVAGRAWIAPTLVGAVLSPLVLLNDLGPILGRLVFYGIWQAGYAVALALTLPQARSKQKSGPL